MRPILGAYLADHLEACRHVLELLGHVGADLTQPAAARGATTVVAGRIMRSIGGGGTMNVGLAWQVGGQLAIDTCAVGRSLWLRHRLGRRMFTQWCAFDQSDLRVIGLLERPYWARRARSHCSASLSTISLRNASWEFRSSTTRNSASTVWGALLVVGTEIYCPGLQRRLLLMAHRRLVSTVVQAASSG